ncbi:MAG: glutamate racemase [Steroidobacteraceae bacterium]
MSAAAAPDRAAPIGVFDSGVGGLTVLAALRARLPTEHFIYLGDTARLPYGTKSGETVVRYALQASEALVERGIKALVVACNTATAAALPALRERFPELPVIGVVDPGAEAACAATRSGRIAVIATEGTVRGGAYQQAILRGRPDADVAALPCQLFVALAEEGWASGPVVDAAIRAYLEPLFASPQPDVLVLGCTHFPMLRAALEDFVGDGVTLVDSAVTTAAAVEATLAERGLLRGAGPRGAVQLLATDGVERFARVGSRFLGEPIAPADVALIDL